MEYAQPVKQKNTLLWVILGIALSCMILCTVGGIFVFNAGRGFMGQAFTMVGCGMDLEAARGALRRYAEKNDGKLPTAANWQDAAKPYFAEERAKLDEQDLKEMKRIGIDVKLSPVDGVWGCTVGEKEIHAFAFNKELSGMKLSDIKEPLSTVLLFETTESKRNHSAAYTVQKPTPEMKIANELRPFLNIKVQGEFDMGQSGRTNVTISTGSSSE